jgi:hypothetical protein
VPTVIRGQFSVVSCQRSEIGLITLLLCGYPIQFG